MYKIADPPAIIFSQLPSVDWAIRAKALTIAHGRMILIWLAADDCRAH
jgi:hypothetical protein